jgi:5-methylcytosine-specific restriction endonuclease McrA
MLPVDHPDRDMALTADHVKPVAKGGKTKWWNIVAAHYSCNNSRSNAKPAHIALGAIEADAIPLRPETDR